MLTYSTTADPMPEIIVFVKPTDDYPATCAGMNEFPTFQINAYMSYSLSRTITAKEYQVTFFEVSFSYFVALILQFFCVSWHLDTIYFPIDLINHA